MVNTKKMLWLTIVSLVVLVLTILTGSVYAGTANVINGVETYDTAGNVKTTTYGDSDAFMVGDDIYISWAQQPGTYTVDVSATNPSGSAVSLYKVPSQLDTPVAGVTPEGVSWVNQGNAAKQCIVIHATTPGIYHVKVDGSGGATLSLAVVVNSVSVLPESPIGVFASFTAVGVAFAVFMALKRFKNPVSLPHF